MQNPQHDCWISKFPTEQSWSSCLSEFSLSQRAHNNKYEGKNSCLVPNWRITYMISRTRLQFLEALVVKKLEKRQKINPYETCCKISSSPSYCGSSSQRALSPQGGAFQLSLHGTSLWLRVAPGHPAPCDSPVFGNILVKLPKLFPRSLSFCCCFRMRHCLL